MLRILFRHYLEIAHGISGGDSAAYVEKMLSFHAGMYWYLRYGVTLTLPFVILLSHVIDNESNRKYAFPVVGLGFRYLDSLVTYLAYE